MQGIRKIIIISTLLFCAWACFHIGKRIKQRWIIEKTIKSTHWQQRSETIGEAVPGKIKTVFLGNSLTEMFALDYYFNDPGILNAGITGDFSEGLLERADQIIRLKPGKLFIEIGINDIIEKIPLADISNNYRELIRRIQKGSPETKIFIQSNLPVIIRHRGLFNDDDSVNRKVVKQNENLEKLAKELNCTYVDIFNAFAKEKDKESLFIPDGVHLTGKAYEIWKKQIIAYI